MPDVKVDGFNVYHGGQGPAIVLLHSMAASAWSWSRSIPLLEEHFTVSAPDLLGHGKSEAKRDVVSVEHHAASVEHLCEQLGLTEPFYLAGAALGSITALEMAVRQPSLVKGLLLLGTPAFPSNEARAAWLANRISTWVEPNGLAAPLDEATIKARYTFHTPDLVERVNQERAQAGMWASHDIWAIGTYDAPARAAQLKVPATICYGEKDPFLPGQPAMQSALPAANHVLLEGVGHYPAWDVPEKVLELALALTA